MGNSEWSGWTFQSPASDKMSQETCKSKYTLWAVHKMGSCNIHTQCVKRKCVITTWCHFFLQYMCVQRLSLSERDRLCVCVCFALPLFINRVIELLKYWVGRVLLTNTLNACVVLKALGLCFSPWKCYLISCLGHIQSWCLGQAVLAMLHIIIGCCHN